VKGLGGLGKGADGGLLSVANLVVLVFKLNFATPTNSRLSQCQGPGSLPYVYYLATVYTYRHRILSLSLMPQMRNERGMGTSPKHVY
jgi:hypothetical protein